MGAVHARVDDLAGALLPQPLPDAGVSLDAHAVPPEADVEEPGVAEVFGLVGADVEVEALLDVVEVVDKQEPVEGCEGRYRCLEVCVEGCVERGVP